MPTTAEEYSSAFTIHGPYVSKKSGRQHVVVIDNRTGERRTVSYPKWIMELQLGRPLDPETETIDHLDSNFDNNDLDNLRIVPRSEHSADDTRRVKLVKFICPWCQKEFERSPRLVRDKAKKGKSGPFHSKECAGKYSRMLQLKLIDKFDVQPVVDSEYYKRKYVQASQSIITTDFLIDWFCDVWEPDGNLED